MRKYNIFPIPFYPSKKDRLKARPFRCRFRRWRSIYETLNPEIKRREDFSVTFFFRIQQFHQENQIATDVIFFNVTPPSDEDIKKNHHRFREIYRMAIPASERRLAICCCILATSALSSKSAFACNSIIESCESLR